MVACVKAHLSNAFDGAKDIAAKTFKNLGSRTVTVAKRSKYEVTDGNIIAKVVFVVAGLFLALALAIWDKAASFLPETWTLQVPTPALAEAPQLEQGGGEGGDGN